jgi:hypothetical protein
MKMRISNLSEFTRGLEFEKEETAKLADTVARGIATDICSRVIFDSPVDTGRFRGNWQVDIGSDPTGELDRLDKDGDPTLDDNIARMKTGPAMKPIYVVNNLPYADRLNSGHSKQAPAGFVERAIDASVKPFK